MNDRKELDQMRRRYIHETEVYLAARLGPAWPYDNPYKSTAQPDALRTGRPQPSGADELVQGAACPTGARPTAYLGQGSSAGAAEDRVATA